MPLPGIPLIPGIIDPLGIEWPGMSVPGIVVGIPHSVSQPFICSISGPWAFLIWLASSVTRGSIPCLPRIKLLISMACW